MLTVRVNQTEIAVAEGTTILAAAAAAGVEIPTLCHMENRRAIGACRVCLVEVEGARALVASCATPVVDGMQIRTTTPRVRDARRAVLELILSEHDGDCQTCGRSEDCELRGLARDAGVREVTYQGERGLRLLDLSTPGLVRDTGKCIKCRRCVTACTDVQGVGALFPQDRGFATVIGPAFRKDLAEVVCVQCGQCAAVCPVGAIGERPEKDLVWAALADRHKHVVVQTAPAIRAALGECFGYPPGTRVTGQMVAALRRLGFAQVFDTNFAADLTIMEEGHELLARLTRALQEQGPATLPMFTSCSPGWINFAEQLYPDVLGHLSTCKSPQQMFGAVAKTYYAAKLGRRPEEIFVVSVMPCTAKKLEARRPEMGRDGVRDVDAVLTTRELGEMIREAGLDFRALPDEAMDTPFGLSSGAADIFANTGGVMEAALRTVYEVVTGREVPFPKLHLTPIAGLDGVKEAALTLTGLKPAFAFLEGVTLRIAVAHGLANARRVLDDVRAGRSPYHFVEVMTCPGGCIGGGGQPRPTTDAVRHQRIAAIYAEDEGKALRKSHENRQIQRLYEEFLGAPLGEKSHALLHTHYRPRVV
ncbi:MAG TPA: NADH-dependent [FeFe] hydrogenase, group A6 [Polyangia bacterium]|jgi:iron-only hydrogenase group A